MFDIPQNILCTFLPLWFLSNFSLLLYGTYFIRILTILVLRVIHYKKFINWFFIKLICILWCTCFVYFLLTVFSVPLWLLEILLLFEIYIHDSFVFLSCCFKCLLDNLNIYTHTYIRTYCTCSCILRRRFCVFL